MIFAWLFALVLGAALGYYIAQRASRTHWQNVLEERQLALRSELEAATQQIHSLRQDNADLSYKLGESEKTRRYLENKNNNDTPE